MSGNNMLTASETRQFTELFSKLLESFTASGQVKIQFKQGKLSKIEFGPGSDSDPESSSINNLQGPSVTSLKQQPSDGHERFLLLDEVARRIGLSPRTIISYRSKGWSHKLPPIVKRGDGRLGCLESELDKFMLENYRPRS